MKKLLIVAALLAGGAAIAQGPPPAPKPTTLSSRPGATGGEALYLEHCASCHAPNGILAPGKSGIWPKGQGRRA